jgi:hypothetical protein
VGGAGQAGQQQEGQVIEVGDRLGPDRGFDARIRAPGTEISPALVAGAAASNWISVVRPRAAPAGSAARTTT